MLCHTARRFAVDISTHLVKYRSHKLLIVDGLIIRFFADMWTWDVVYLCIGTLLQSRLSTVC